jgi:hypothetical protein
MKSLSEMQSTYYNASFDTGLRMAAFEICTRVQGGGSRCCLLRRRSVAERNENQEIVCVSSARARGRVPHARGRARTGASYLDAGRRRRQLFVAPQKRCGA